MSRAVISDRFVLECEVASGGMGRVYRGRDRVSDHVVAVKFMLGDAADDCDRFLREASALAALDHPGVVRHVAHGFSGGAPFLAMEWLEGCDLARRLHEGPLTFDETLTVARRVASALAAVHAHGIIHRDLKPHNLVLVHGRLEDITLIDFGVARRPCDVRRLTQSGTIVGTPAYMAPEQARGHADLDARVDVFALGVVLFECLTGSTPFVGSGLFEVFAQLLLEDVPTLSSRGIDAPPWFDRLIARMMSKDKGTRPRDGAAVLEALDAADRAATVTLPAPPPSPAITCAERRLLCILVLGHVGADPLG